MPIPFLPGVRKIAVVGASRNPEKWGYKILKRLMEIEDIEVYPINPKADEILGLKAYPDLRSLPEVPDMVITVVPPEVTENVVKEALLLGVRIIWMQPGSGNKKIAKIVERARGEVFLNKCILRSLALGKIA